MKIFTPRQMFARCTVAFALGVITTWGAISAWAFLTQSVTRMKHSAEAFLITEKLIQERREKNPSFEEALHKAVTAEPKCDLTPRDPSVWHPVGELTAYKKSDAPGMPLAYSETQVAGKYLVIYSAGVDEWDSTGSEKWVTPPELHALLDRRKNPANSTEKP